MALIEGNIVKCDYIRHRRKMLLLTIRDKSSYINIRFFHFTDTQKKSFLIDGDVVRDLISFDLGYKKSDRIKQNKRVLGIAKIVIKNGYYPIISSVYLDPKIAGNAKKNGIKIVNVVTTNKRVNRKLLNKKNIVGKSIKQPKINCEIINVK